MRKSLLLMAKRKSSFTPNNPLLLEKKLHTTTNFPLKTKKSDVFVEQRIVENILIKTSLNRLKMCLPTAGFLLHFVLFWSLINFCRYYEIIDCIDWTKINKNLVTLFKICDIFISCGKVAFICKPCLHTKYFCEILSSK